MKFVGRLVHEDGQIAEFDKVSLVQAGARSLEELAHTGVKSGKFTLQASPEAAWGILVDDRAVLAFPRSATIKTTNLGDIVMLKEPLPLAVFHALDQRVFGVSDAINKMLVSTSQEAGARLTMETGAAATSSAAATPSAAAIPSAVAPTSNGTVAGKVTSRMTFAHAFGSTAKQLSEVKLVDSGFLLDSASVSLKGIPQSDGEALALGFPDADLAHSAQGLSELNFRLKSKAKAASVQGSEPESDGQNSQVVSDLVGYTRELAQRKVNAAGLNFELHSEMVSDEKRRGRVVRQSPIAGTTVETGALLRLYVGK